MSSAVGSLVASRAARLTRASLLRLGLSAILASADSGNSIHRGIFRRRPVASLTVTAPSPRFGRPMT